MFSILPRYPKNALPWDPKTLEIEKNISSLYFFNPKNAIVFFPQQQFSLFSAPSQISQAWLRPAPAGLDKKHIPAAGRSHLPVEIHETSTTPWWSWWFGIVFVQHRFTISLACERQLIHFQLCTIKHHHYPWIIIIIVKSARFSLSVQSSCMDHGQAAMPCQKK